jgi:hypothetical protein
VIIINMEDFSWGTAEVDGYPNSRRLNFLDPESKLRFTLIFGGDPLKVLVEELIPGLTGPQAESLIGLLQLQRDAGVVAQPTTNTANDDVVDGEIASEEEDPA